MICCSMLAAGLLAAGTACATPPVPMVWQFNAETLKRKQYLKDIDFIEANTLVDLLAVAPVDHVNPEDPDQFHDAFKEMVEYARAKGIRVVLRQQPNMKGFFNASVDGGDAGTYVIEDQSEAQGIAYESEATLDAEGFASVTETAKWGRNKIRPLRNELLAVYAFEKVGEGFHAPGSVVDVTSRARVVSRTSSMQTIEIDGGAALAGKSVYVLTAQYFNSVDQFGGAMARYQAKIMDSLADVPLAGLYLDETGYMLLNTSGVGAGKAPPWRGRFYSAAQADWWRTNRKVDLKRLLFEMRYAPQGDEGVRIRAINDYMEVMRTQPCRSEREMVRHQKRVWGEDVFLACHSTFHNYLGDDEVWHTGCDWWDVPRDFGFTDEGIDYPTRMGVLFGAKEPFLLHMFYSKNAADYYHQIVRLLPFKGREFHHAYNDDVWGKGFKGNDMEFLGNIRRFDEEGRRLNALQANVMPRMDGLVVFGMPALCNWYPDAKARNRWDIDGSLRIQEKADELWKLGYRVALVPDSKIEQGVLRLENGKFIYNGRPFSHCVFLCPKYSKRCVYDFLNAASDAKMPLAVVGRADIDFKAQPASFRGLHYDVWSPKVAEAIGMRKSAIPGGCVYDDGSFCLVSDALVTGGRTQFDFVLDGVRHAGSHTGVYFWRGGKVAYATGTLSLETCTTVVAP
ncbi:MAG: hypothetical protein KBT68_01485 [bacterium]|nr:hypothetical protein [Candidatus Colisoma equi]